MLIGEAAGRVQTRWIAIALPAQTLRPWPPAGRHLRPWPGRPEYDRHRPASETDRHPRIAGSRRAALRLAPACRRSGNRGRPSHWQPSSGSGLLHPSSSASSFFVNAVPVIRQPSHRRAPTHDARAQIRTDQGRTARGPSSHAPGRRRGDRASVPRSRCANRVASWR